jgi:hypothetical protein
MSIQLQLDDNAMKAHTTAFRAMRLTGFNEDELIVQHNGNMAAVFSETRRHMNMAIQILRDAIAGTRDLPFKVDQTTIQSAAELLQADLLNTPGVAGRA